MKSKTPVVHAVVVSFNPVWSELIMQLQLLLPQVQKIWVIDNASTEHLVDRLVVLGLGDILETVSMPSNMGLGAAQNMGIECARSDNATHVLIMDQDSQPEFNMVPHLLAAWKHLRSLGINVAAVAPTYVDSDDGLPSSFVRIGWLGFKLQDPVAGQIVVEADFLISSGSLIPLSVIDDIGLMDETLFIDHVDTDWCMRARSQGYQLFGVPSARMLHSLGEQRKLVWFFRWRNVSFHSSFRYYYMLRNSLLLQRRPYMPLKWRVADMLRCIRIFCFYSIFSSGRIDRLRMMIKGLWHGFRGISGSLKT